MNETHYKRNYRVKFCQLIKRNILLVSVRLLWFNKGKGGNFGANKRQSRGAEGYMTGGMSDEQIMV